MPLSQGPQGGPVPLAAMLQVKGNHAAQRFFSESKPVAKTTVHFDDTLVALPDATSERAAPLTFRCCVQPPLDTMFGSQLLTNKLENRVCSMM